MYSAREISELHAALQAHFKNNPVLLGGSYLYSEAHEGSDLDFYVLCSLISCFRYAFRRRKISAFKRQFSSMSFSIMLVPGIFFRRGWYYIYGKNSKQQLYQSPVNRKIIFRQCLKFGYYYFLQSLLERDQVRQQYLREKAARQLCVAQALVSQETLPEPLFSTKNARAEYILSLNEQNFLTVARNIEEQGKKYLRFSLFNYVLYNIRFLFLGDRQFLFRNPDHWIIRSFQQGLRSQYWPGLCEQMKQMVFLTWIF